MRRCVQVALVAAIITAAVSVRADAACASGWSGFRPPDSELEICWSATAQMLSVEMSHPGEVWIALGFADAMAGADAIVGRPDTGEVTDVFIGGYDVASIIADAQQDVRDVSAVFADGRTIVKFSRSLAAADPADQAIVAGKPMPVIWAVGNTPGFSTHFARGIIRMDWTHAAPSVWRASALLLHAALMLAAWMLMLPLGVLIARYYKVRAGQNFPQELDNQFWWHAHLVLQYGGMLLAFIGLFMVWVPPQGVRSAHGIAGMAAMGLGVLQVLGGVLRGSKGGPVDVRGRRNPPDKVRGDHYDMTRRRRVFEVLHKSGGYITLLSGGGAVILGLRQLGAHGMAYAALVAWVGVMLAWALRLHRSGRWVDTYHAIWGMDPIHPGNRPWQNAQQHQGEKNEH